MTANPQPAFLSLPHRPVPTATGIGRGAQVLTLMGVRAVETLQPGDRIVTRSGATVLREVATPAPDSFSLRFDRPEVVFLLGGQVHGDTGEAFVA